MTFDHPFQISSEDLKTPGVDRKVNSNGILSVEYNLILQENPVEYFKAINCNDSFD